MRYVRGIVKMRHATGRLVFGLFAAAVLVAGSGFFYYQTFGLTLFGTTLEGPTDISDHLVAHYTFDGQDIDLSSPGAEIQNRGAGVRLWYDTAWDHRVKITIDKDQVDSNLSNFPVYVDLSDLPSSFFSNVQSDGSDIRVTKGDKITEVAREVVTVDTSNNTGELHFKAPSLSSSSDTTFYIYYGNSGASAYADADTYGTHAVWSNGYRGVWHMNSPRIWNLHDEDFDRTSAQAFEGSYSLGITTNPEYDTGAYIEPDALSGGAQMSNFTYYYRETSDSNGGGVQLFDSSGNEVLGIATDNPQWIVKESGGITQIDGGPDASDYDNWIKVEVDFDWGNDTADVTFTDADNVSDSVTYTATLINSTNIERIRMRNLGETSFSNNTGDWYMWYDNVSFTHNMATTTYTFETADTVREEDVTDSTGNSIATEHEGPYTSRHGVIGGRLQHEDNKVALDYAYTAAAGSLAVSAWFKTGSDNPLASFDASEYWRLETGGDAAASGKVGMTFKTNANATSIDSTTSVTDNAWYHTTFTYNEGNAHLYVNGVEENSTSKGTRMGSGSTRYGFLGSQSEASSFNGTVGGGTQFDGELDEFRLSDVSRTSSWVAASYTNQNTPTTFYAAGNQEDESQAAIASPAGNWQNHATSTTAGRVGQGIDFDGSDDVIDIGALSTVNSVSFWVNMDDSGEEYFELANGVSVGSDADTTDTWFDASWEHRVPITISSDQVTNDRSDYPVAFDLSALPSHFFSNVQTDGADIRITTSDKTTAVTHEVVSIDTGSATGKLRFNAPSLNSSSDTTFYIYYGNAAASDPGNTVAANYDFEDGSFDADWSQTTNFNIFSSPSRGAKSAGQDSGNAIDAILAPADLSGGKKIDTLEFYWNETSSQTGFAFEIEDDAGNDVLRAGGDNPQWRLEDGDGTPTVKGDDGVYNVWVRYTFDFDWSAGEYTYDMEDATNGVTRSGTRSLKTSTNVAQIKINNSKFGTPDHMWFDDIRIDGIYSFSVGSRDDVSKTGESTVTTTGLGSPTVYVDGEKTTTVPESGWHHITVVDSSGVDATDVKLGVVGSTYYDGVMDDVRFYDTALSQREAKRLYGLGGTTEIGVTQEGPVANALTAHYTFDGQDIDLSSPGAEIQANGTGTSGVTGAWYNDNWLYRIKLTIDKDQIDSDLSNFPVYVDLSDLPSSFFSNVQSDGADIRVTKGDKTTEVAREVVTLDTSNNTGELHFKAPSLSSSSDTEFYIYYGNSGASGYAASDTYGTENVWTNGYDIVQHMNEDPSGTSPQLIDSTANNYDGSSGGSMTSSDVVSGRLGDAIAFDGSDDDFGIGSYDGQSTNAPWTFQAIVRLNSSADLTASHEIFTHGNTPKLAYNVTNSNEHFEIESGALAESNTSPAADTWYWVSGEIDSNGDAKIFVNGSLENTASGLSTSYNSGGGGFIGADNDGTRYLFGAIDELRIATSTRANGWFSAEYTNQNSSTTFYSVGAEKRKGSNLSDLSGNWQNHGTSTTAGRIGQGITFDGSDDVIDVDNSLRTVNTVSFWVKPNDGGEDYLELANGVSIGSSASTTETWYDSAWNHRAKITIDKDQVDSDLSNFPVYVDLSSLPAGFFDAVQSDGSDIRVTKGDKTTEVAREVVSVDTNNSTGELHFKAPSLSSSSNTEFYIYYGNSGASGYTAADTYGAENVWTNSYTMVQHLDEDPSGTSAQFEDSTSNAHDGTSNGSMTSGDQVAGQVGGATNFDGSDDSISFDASNINSLSTYTLTWWFKETEVSTKHKQWADSASSPEFRTNNGNYEFYDGGSYINLNGATVNAWTHLVLQGEGDGGSVTLYENGSSHASSGSGNSTILDDGSFYLARGVGGFENYMDGNLDEYRISSAVRSSAWISAEYTNQNSPTTFYTVDSQESAGRSASGTITTTGFNSPTVYVDGEQTTDLPDSGWHHITVVDSSGVNAADVTLGVVSGTHYDGVMDDVRFYDTALSSEQINRVYGLGATTHVNTTQQTTNEGNQPDLVGHWTFDGQHMDWAATDEARDQSGQGNHGTVTNVGSGAAAIGNLGQGLSFSGTDEYVDVGNVGSVQSAAFWIRPDTQTEKIFELSSTVNIELSSGFIATAGFNSPTVYVDGQQTSTVPDDNSWHHVVVVDTSTVTADAVRLGRIGSSYYAGSLDDVRLYNRALSGRKIDRLYQLGD